MGITVIGLGHVEVGDALLVQAEVPAHRHVVLGLRLLQLLVIVCLQLDQGAKDVLVLVGIIVPVHMQHNLHKILRINRPSKKLFFLK